MMKSDETWVNSMNKLESPIKRWKAYSLKCNSGLRWKAQGPDETWVYSMKKLESPIKKTGKLIVSNVTTVESLGFR